MFRHSRIDVYHRLTMAALRSMGFKPPELHPPMDMKIASLNMSVSIVERNGLVYIHVVTKKDRHHYQEFIQITCVDLQFGRRWYFICPFSGRKALKLYYVNDGFISKKAYNERSALSPYSPVDVARDRVERLVARLNGTDGRGPARGYRRKDALRELRKHEQITRLHPGVGAIEAEEHQKVLSKERAKVRYLHQDRCLRFHEGRWHGKELRPGPLMVGYLAQQPEALRLLPSTVPLGRAISDTGVVQEHPSLDIRTILHPEASGGFSFWGSVLGWPVEATEGKSITLCVDLRNADAPVLLVDIDYVSDKPSTRQVVELGRSGNGRWLMRCPIQLTLAESLYFRHGRFASRAAQNLRYRSQ